MNYEVDLVLMPLNTEGFGLTGLEALSARCPVLTSARTGMLENLWAVCDWALSLSLTLKIPVHGQQPSRVSGTETESHNLTRLRLSKAPIVKHTFGLNSAKLFLKAWL